MFRSWTGKLWNPSRTNPPCCPRWQKKPTMLLHDLRLAAVSCKRTPTLTALMIAAIAAGIGACMVTVTIYHSLSVDPIWWKRGKLFAVTVDAKSNDPKDQW